jgi:hypothetical protein
LIHEDKSFEKYYLCKVLIFLDIDGVMLSAAGWKPVENLEDGFSAFSKRAVDCLQYLVQNTNASVILTTSHKSRFTLEQWNQIFQTRNLSVHICDKLDDNLNSLNRKDEILNYLNAHPEIENYVILDDDKSLNDLPKSVKEKLVLTSSLIGLTQENIERAIEILTHPTLVGI